VVAVPAATEVVSVSAPSRPAAPPFVVTPALEREIKSRLFHLEREAVLWRSVLDMITVAEVAPTGRATAAAERALSESRRIASRVEAAKIGFFRGRRPAFQSNVLAAVLNRSSDGLTTRARDVQAFFLGAGQSRPNLHAVTAALSRLVKKRAVRRVKKGEYVSR